MNHTKKVSLVLAVLGLALITPAFAAHAQVGVNANASSTITIGSVAKGKDDAAIGARVTALNDLLARVNMMTKVSDSEKASLIATINANLSDMTNLQAKINADTDKTTLKADVQSITKSYRIYALILPQTRIIAAADRISDTVSILTNVQTQLQADITQAQSSGKDVSAATSANADLTAKLADASAKGQAAVTLVTPLQPDQGSATVAASNKAALVNARTDIRAAIADLVAALKDANAIRSVVVNAGITVQ